MEVHVTRTCDSAAFPDLTTYELIVQVVLSEDERKLAERYGVAPLLDVLPSYNDNAYAELVSEEGLVIEEGNALTAWNWQHEIVRALRELVVTYWPKAQAFDGHETITIAPSGLIR